MPRDKTPSGQFDMFNQDTLTAEKARLERERKTPDGTRCKACGQYCKEYARTIHSSMAKAAITAYHMVGGKPNVFFHTLKVGMHCTACSNGKQEMARLALWELTFPRNEDEDTRGRTSGWWAFTSKGVAWIKNEIGVPKYAITYNDALLRLEGEEITIRKCLSDLFDYKELMKRAPAPKEEALGSSEAD